MGMGAFIEDGSVGICQLSGRSVYCDPHETKGPLVGTQFQGYRSRQAAPVDDGRLQLTDYQPNMEVAWPK